MQLEDLAPLLLEPGKLVVKTINGNSVTGKDLLKYFKVWYDVIVVHLIIGDGKGARGWTPSWIHEGG